MHPLDCPAWEYKNDPRHSAILPTRCAEALYLLRTEQLDSAAAAQDTRPVHQHLFRELAPSDALYYAGNYRGSPYRCLEYLSVRVPANPAVGFPPHQVSGEMRVFVQELRTSLAALDAVHQQPSAQVPKEMKLYTTVVVACRAHSWFVHIHPYANGNGHAGRFVVFSILGRYGYWLNRWTVDPNPAGVLPYIQMINDAELCESQLLADIV